VVHVNQILGTCMTVLLASSFFAPNNVHENAAETVVMLCLEFTKGQRYVAARFLLSYRRSL
jgi:hypothetical protein